MAPRVCQVSNTFNCYAKKQYLLLFLYYKHLVCSDKKAQEQEEMVNQKNQHNNTCSHSFFSFELFLSHALLAVHMSSSLNQRCFSLLKFLLRVGRSPDAAVSLLPCHYTMKKRWSRLFFPKLCVHIKDNNSPRGKFHRFLFPFSSKFPDLNVTLYVLYIYLCYKNSTWHNEPRLPVAKSQ